MASKVAVIMGGTSFERNFSLLSGRLVSESLARSGFDVLTLDADAHLVDTLRAEKPDVAFICMHERMVRYLRFWSFCVFRTWGLVPHHAGPHGTKPTCHF